MKHFELLHYPMYCICMKFQRVDLGWNAGVNASDRAELRETFNARERMERQRLRMEEHYSLEIFMAVK